MLERSGFINMTEKPHWQLYHTKQGGAVALDAAPEPGCMILNDSLLFTNHGVWFDTDEGVLDVNEEVYLSYIVAAGTRDMVYIRTGSNTAGKSRRTWFNVKSGEICLVDPTHSHAMVMDLGSGVYRVGIAFTPEDLDSPAQREIHLGIAAADGANAFIADPGEAMMVFFSAQLDYGDFPFEPVVHQPGG